MFWMLCQIFQFCAWRLAGATAPVRRAGRLAGQDAHAYGGCLDIRLLPTRLAGVLEGRAADCRGGRSR